ncbi:hypothetical protein GGI07_003413 [Coemansia sp. Benny D115]|nr:hypothetical protein GGI07_003413 [Coemansia sp. Benny D115]
MYLIAGRRKKTSRPNARAASSDTPDSAAEEEQQPSTRDAEAQEEDGDGSYPDAVDGLVDDADLDDPALLGELEALRAEMGLVAVPERKREPRLSGHTDTDAAIAPPSPGAFDADDRAVENVVATEEDMNDPHLLAELSGLGLANPAPPTTSPVATPRVSTAATAPAPTLAPAPAFSSVPAEEDATDLPAQRARLKAAALAAKRAGNMDEAREMLLRLKQVQSLIDAASSQAAPKPASAQNVKPPAPVAAAPSIARHAAAPSTARQSVRQKPARKPKAGPEAEPGREPESVLPASASEMRDLATSFTALKAKLEAQEKEAARLSGYFLRAGDKARALDFHRLRKRALADLATVESHEANKCARPPPLVLREVSWAAPNESRQQSTIGAGELQVEIGRILSTGDLAATLGGRSDFYLQWETTWPRDHGGRRAYTRTMRYAEFEESAGDLHIGYSKCVDFVDRQQMRPLLRWVERGRLVVELYRYSGLLWGSQLVARGSVPLAALRTRAEVTTLLELRAPSADTASALAAAVGGGSSSSRQGKPLAGGPVFVDVAARLRLPLNNKPELVEHVEHWVHVDAAAVAASAIVSPEATVLPPVVAASGPVPEKPKDRVPEAGAADQPQPPHTSQALQAPSEPPASETASVSTPHHTAAAAATPSVDDIALQLDSLDMTTSNAVLELELLQIPARAREAPGDAQHAAHLRDLEAAIKLRMSVVAAQVGAGALTVEQYMDAVRSELAQTREWAVAAKRLGSRDLALRALKRVKAMQAELDEMQAAMEGQAGEEEGE